MMLGLSQNHTNAAQCLIHLWIIAPLFVATGVVSCDRQDAAAPRENVRQPNREVRHTPATRLRHMVDAYRNGDVDAAREAARKYLEQRFKHLLNATSDSERFDWTAAVLAVLKNMLHYENQLPPGSRLGSDSEFVSRTQEILLKTWSVSGDLRGAPDGVKNLIRRSQEFVAREWILARAPDASREELGELYAVFAPALKAQGLDSLDRVLAYQPPEPPQSPKPRKINQQEAARITAVIEKYYTGLITSDVDLVHSATECTPEECQFFFKELREEAQEEGWQSMKGVILPELTAEQLLLRPLPWGERTYRVSYSDVTFVLLMSNGDEIEQTGNKFWTVRDKGDGTWIVLPFK